MKIKHRFSFNTDETNVIHFLEKQNIEYDKSEFTVVFELYEDYENFNEVKRFMETHDAVIIPEAVYTHDEINSARWLTIRSSWENLYPQPEDDMKYRFTTYDSTDYCEGNEPSYYCRKGLIQKESFVLKKEPNWGSRNFMMLHWVADELFISPKAEEVLRSSDLTGFEIYNVLSKSKKKLEGIKQIFVKTYLPEGFSADSIERKLTCPKCNFTKYWPKTGAFRFHKGIFEGVQDDIVKTTDKFWETGCDSLILITHKFYDVIKNAKLDRGLVFEPIELI
jgi:hypothetical protein